MRASLISRSSLESVVKLGEWLTWKRKWAIECAKERLFQKINKKDSKYREEQEDLAQQWQKEIEKWEDQHMANYRRIYPGVDTAQKYDRFYTQSGTLYSETAASKARQEQAK